MYTLILKIYIFFHFSSRGMPLSVVIHTKAKYKMNNELLQRYIAGDATEAERKQVLEWIEESPEHLHAYKVQRKLYDITLWHTNTTIENAESNKHFSWKKPVMEILKIAAIFILIFIGNHYWWNKPEKTETVQSIYVPAGQRAELMLADGTKVWLNSRSRLTFPGSFDGNTRNVKLDGEGYFAVKSDTEHPFIVETNRYNVRVLGTEFNVIAYSNDSVWETSLLKGKVEILANGTEVKLEPDTKLSLQGNKLVKGNIKEMDYFRWREGLICFHNISLSDIMEKLELYYGVNIIVNNRNILHNHYTGKFRTGDGIEHVLRVLRLSNQFSYTKDDETNTITIN